MRKVALFIVPVILVVLTLLVGAEANKEEYKNLSFSGVKMQLGSKCHEDINCINNNFKSAVFGITKRVIKFNKTVNIALLLTDEDSQETKSMIEQTLAQTFGQAGIKYNVVEKPEQANMVILASSSSKAFAKNKLEVAKCVDWVGLAPDKFNAWQGFNRAIVKIERDKQGLRTGGIDKVFVSFLKGSDKEDFKLTLLSAIGLPGLKSFAQKYVDVVKNPITVAGINSSNASAHTKLKAFNNIVDLMTRIYYSKDVKPNADLADFTEQYANIYNYNLNQFKLGKL